MTRVFLIVLGLSVLAAQAETVWAQATDRVKLVGDVQVRGTVDSMTALEVVMKQSASREKKVPLNEIVGVVFVSEPVGLSQARLQVSNSQYEKARQSLDSIEPADVERDFIKQEIQFFQALCAAKLALAGSGEIRNAGGEMLAFAKAHENNYHYLQAAETLGDLLAAVGNVDDAVKWYAKLAQAPWPEYKIRSALLAGKAFMGEERFADALTHYDEALAISATTGAAEAQQTAAKLEKAICLAETGDIGQGVKMALEVIGEASPEEAALHAKAYNTLGYCQTKAGETKEALFAYLHVDVLYNAISDEHAEALTNLTTLWAAVGEPGRAREAEALLEERYPDYDRAR